MACGYFFRGKHYTEEEFDGMLKATLFQLNAPSVKAPDLYKIEDKKPRDYRPTMKGVMDMHEEIQDVDPTDNKYRYRGQSNPRITDREKGMMSLFVDKRSGTGDLAERRAARIWDHHNIDPAERRSIPGVGFVNKEEFIAKTRAWYEFGIAKGNIVHLLLERATTASAVRIAQINQRIYEIAQKAKMKADPMETYSWVTKHVKDIYRMNHINVLEEGVEPKDKDIVQGEVKIFSETLGYAGRIDQLSEDKDGYLSITEFKTGRSLEYNGHTIPLKYGRQFVDICDNPREIAKLQVMMQAVILKSQFPDAKFKNLAVHWIPNGETALQDDTEKNVEVGSYLAMIESYFKNEQPEVYAKAIEKSPKLFDPSEYGHAEKSIVDEVMTPGASFSRVIKDKLAQLRYAYGEYKGTYTKEQLDTVRKNTKELTSLLRDPGSKLDAELNPTHDISTMTRYLGYIGDVSADNPLLRAYTTLYQQRKHAVNNRHTEYMMQFQSLLKDVKREYLEKRGGPSGDLLNNIRYDDLYDFMWYKTEPGSAKPSRFVTPGDKEQWTKLTPAQKAFARFVNDTINKELIEVMDTVAWEHEGKTKTFGDIYRMKRADAKLDYGFAPKMPITDEEIRYTYGVFSKESFRILKQKVDLASSRDEIANPDCGLAIKFLGSDELESTEMFSKNLEKVYDQFMKSLIAKQELDDVFFLGQGIKTYLDIEGGQDKVYENTAKFMEAQLRHNLLNKKEQLRWTRTKIPFGKGNMDIDKMLRLFKKWTSWSIMWIQPVRGISNGIFTYMVSRKNAMVGTIGHKFAGINNIHTDWDESDMRHADGLFLEMQKDFMMGKGRENKTYLLLRHLHFLPDNFDYMTKESNLVAQRNPKFTESNMYIFHSMFEDWNSTIIMAAQLSHLRLPDGRRVIDAYEVQDKTFQVGKETKTYKDLVWTGGVRGYVRQQGLDGKQQLVELTDLTEQEIDSMRRVYQRLQGGYRKEERTHLEAYALGEVLLQYKKYLPSLLIHGMRSRTNDNYLGAYQKSEIQAMKDGKTVDVYEWVARVQEGRYRVLTNHILTLLKLRHDNQYRWSTMPEDLKMELIDAYYTIFSYLTLLMAYSVCFPPDEKDPRAQNIKRILDNYSQHYNPVDIARSLRSTAAMLTKGFTTATSLGEVLFASGAFAAGDTEDGGLAFTQEGDLRGWNNLQKGIPLLSSNYEIQKFAKACEDNNWQDVWMSDGLFR